MTNLGKAILELTTALKLMNEVEFSVTEIEDDSAWVVLEKEEGDVAYIAIRIGMSEDENYPGVYTYDAHLFPVDEDDKDGEYGPGETPYLTELMFNIGAMHMIIVGSNKDKD